MLNKQSMPVWVLADVMLVLLCTGGLVSVMMIPRFWQAKRTESKLAARWQQIAEKDQQISSAHIENTQLEKKIGSQNGQIQRLSNELDKVQKQFVIQRHQERMMRQELLGLRGEMSRTVFVVDTSGSISEQIAGATRPNWGGDGSAWGFVKNQVAAWVRFLPVTRYRIIAFNDDLTQFPAIPVWARQSTDNQDALDFLNGIEPGGRTETELALREAVKWNPTSIVLITDGAPSDQDGKFDREQIKRIIQWVCSDQMDVPVNVVAVNNYFDQEFCQFLHQLAAESGGSFIGL